MTPALETRALHLWYGAFQVLKNVTMQAAPGRITSLIGPSGCGKSTLLRCWNRMNERFASVRTSGQVLVHGCDVHDPDVSLVELRKSVGMVFQRPNPLPISIYENVAFGLRVHGTPDQLHPATLEQQVELALRQVGLWADLKDHLQKPATHLPLDQQQKLCIARLLPLRPQVILMDEPCSALDAQGTQAIEELMFALRGTHSIVIVTHNMGQARRASDDCIFMLLGELVEMGSSSQIFSDPQDPRTAAYIRGEYA